MWRWFLLRIDVLQKAHHTDHFSLVAGTKEDMEHVNNLLQPAGRHQNVEGFISPLNEEHSLGTITNVKNILQSTPANELIFCQSNHLSFSQIISLYEQTGRLAKLRLHAYGSSSIIGSDSKNEAGQVLNTEEYRLSLAVNLRLKRLVDLISAILLLLVFPLHFLLNKHPLQLMIHCLQVIINQKTWIGFSNSYQHLPVLKPSVLNPAGIPHNRPQINTEGLHLADEWYAREYNPGGDIKIILTSYKKLGQK
jgi:hypothetical protein